MLHKVILHPIQVLTCAITSLPGNDRLSQFPDAKVIWVLRNFNGDRPNEWDQIPKTVGHVRDEFRSPRWHRRFKVPHKHSEFGVWLINVSGSLPSLNTRSYVAFVVK